MTRDHKLAFFASMTISVGDIQKIRQLLATAGVSVNPLNHVLVTPVFSSNRTLSAIRELAEQGSRICFDSGGYYVQIGKVKKFEDLYLPLLKAYTANPWASIYTLPDHVPTSKDSDIEVEHKVKNTIDYSLNFLKEMPRELFSKAMPVVHGRTLKQVDDCLRAYIGAGVSYIGFGSFGTGGKNNEVNVTTTASLELARYVVEVAHMHGIKVHFFGVGRPALLTMIKALGADSCDSSSWMKAAGFGQVFLPFSRGYSMTYRPTVSRLERGISFAEFRSLAELSGHACALCKSEKDLQHSKMCRTVHNLICVAETVDMLNRAEFDRIKLIYQAGSPKYRDEFEKWTNSKYISGPEQPLTA